MTSTKIEPNLEKSTLGKSKQSSATIRLIGDRASGKTTYMASLAYWPNASANSLIQQVIPVNDESIELVEKARNILEQGLSLEPTQLNSDADELTDYTLSLKLQDPSRTFGFGKKQLTLNISCKDYPGEFFSDLLHRNSQDGQLRSYLDDCLQAQGILLLLDGLANRKDAEYAAGLETFFRLMDQSEIDLKKRRIAFTLCKCEQAELWVNHHDPFFLASSRFPKTFQALQEWERIGAGSFSCFTTSAFGMLGNNFPRPNSTTVKRQRDGVASIIKDPERWKPFGLFAPVYWLCTGNQSKALLKE